MRSRLARWAQTRRLRRGMGQRARGQALVEYALILALVVFAIVLILTLTGPAVGNVFSNTVFNLLNLTTTPRATMSDAEFWQMATSVASITPQSVDVRTNTPVARAGQPPIARTDNYNIVTATSTTLTVNAAGGVLANDADINVPAAIPLTVATFTQPTCAVPGTCGSVTVNADGSFVYTAGAYTGGFVSFTYVVQNTQALSATGLVNIGVDMAGSPPETAVPTRQPSATPPDLQQSYPFYDDAEPLNAPRIWHTRFTNVLHGPWKVDYYNNPSLSAPIVATETRFWRENVETLNMNWGLNDPSLPAGVAPNNFSARFSKTTPFLIEYRRYELVLESDGAAQVIINGTPVLTNGAGGGVKTVMWTPPAPSGPATASPVNVEITYAHTSGLARLRFAMNNFADISKCTWGVQGGVGNYRSEFHSWQDSPNDNYQVSSDCHLRLRGYIDIPSGATEAPRLYFWERWALSATATMQVGVREYNATSDWTWVTLHGPTAGTNLSWRRQEFDLTAFGSPAVDFRGRRIELAFRLVNPSDTLRADGWYIDDISVQDGAPMVFTTFRDDVETPISNQLWVNECSWRRVVSERHGGVYSWTDSPNGNYENGSNCSLTLNGLLDLRGYTGADEPELTFWSKHSLTSTTDQILAEWRSETSTSEADWRPLSVTGSLDPYIARASSNPSWAKYYVNFASQPTTPDLRGQKIQFRFRLLADNDQAADGWYLDDIELRKRPLDVAGVPFYEPFDNADRWLLGGAWGLTQAVPPASAPSHYSPTTALTDSPTGAYAASSNTTAVLIPSIGLTTTTKPVMTFWAYWKSSQANLYLELSTDNGVTWPNRIWENTGPEKVQLAWQRFKIDLSAYRTSSISLRFRLQDVGGSPDDGWYIDDIRIEEDNTTSVPIRSNELLDDFESASAEDEWFVGGDWAVRDDGGRLDFVGVGPGQPGLPSRGFVASPSGNYVKPARSIVEYVRRLDLSGTTSPTLSFFTTYELGDTADRLLVEVSTDNGFTWAGTPVWQNPGRVNLGWHRVLVDLSAYKATPIRIRFRLEAMNTGLSSTGWSLDEFRVYDRALTSDLGSTFSDAFNDLGNWIAEGKWVSAPTTTPSTIYSGWEFRTASLRPVTFSHSAGGAYPTITTSNWVGDYWHIPASNSAVWTGSSPTWPTGAPNIGNDTSPPEVVFDYAADPTNLPFNALVSDWAVGGTANNEYYLMRWTRRYQADRSATYRFRLTLNGGARLYIKPSSASWGAPLT
ncbi:MAG: hypothetical protein IT323_09820, partial [Anaerolineae bacterium]|nr:hypothetical protein [Anaerolineae bacterium]